MSRIWQHEPHLLEDEKRGMGQYDAVHETQKYRPLHDFGVRFDGALGKGLLSHSHPTGRVLHSAHDTVIRRPIRSFLKAEVL